MTREKRIELLRKLQKTISSMQEGTVFQVESILCVIKDKTITSCKFCPIKQVKRLNENDIEIYYELGRVCARSNCNVYYAKEKEND